MGDAKNAARPFERAAIRCVGLRSLAMEDVN
ncbi:hypothetical protein SAMN05519103_01953 [Rhizobiales bacterium GAS113]|nr:hypothetical protein SAMN05519103_01953 [Rhizobiales bacterium GAS113]